MLKKDEGPSQSRQADLGLRLDSIFLFRSCITLLDDPEPGNDELHSLLLSVKTSGKSQLLP